MCRVFLHILWMAFIISSIIIIIIIFIIIIIVIIIPFFTGKNQAEMLVLIKKLT